MRLTGLELEHYRSFAEAEVAFEPGVSVIHGENGAGKTTLLESVLFGLYGASALDDATLADVVTRGEEHASVSLAFVHEGGEYHLAREVAATGQRASTRRAELVEPDGERHEGASAVRERIADLLRMDVEAFVNSAYVKQGEINKLLHATPAERQSMIDELLQLGRLETYRDRADETRLAVRSMVRERAEVIEELERQRDRLQDPDPYERLEDLEAELEEATSKEEALTETRDTVAEQVDDLEDQLATLKERRDRLDELDERRRELQSSLGELAERRQELQQELASVRSTRREAIERRDDLLDELELTDPTALNDEIDTVEADIETVEAEIDEHRSAIESAREQAASASERVTAIEERIEDQQAELSSVCEQLEADETVRDDRREALEDATTALETTVADLDVDAPTREALRARAEEVGSTIDDLEETLRDRRDERAALAEHVEQAAELAEEDRCPTCGQPVDGSPHVEELEADRESLEAVTAEIEELTADLESHRETAEAIEAAIEQLDVMERHQELLDERESVLDERRERRTTLEAAIESANEELEAAREAKATATAAIESTKESIADANERLQSHRQRHERLTAAASAVETVDDLDDELDRLDERTDHLDELETDRRDQLDAIDEELAELEDTLDASDVEELETELETARERLETATSHLDDIRERKGELTEALGSVRSDIDRLEEIEADLEAATSVHEDLAALREEAAELGTLYESVRSELRERNVATLERLLNETFDLLYRNETYEHIDLDTDYALTIRSTDGTELDPSQLSGGERAIFNLSLRCAIYRLLAEGVEGAAPMPPLMLDEPTVFLDQGHVGRLIRLLETMREFGVEQTLVVSHHEALLDAAKHRIAVEKDPSSNRSAVSTLAAVEPPG